MNRLFRWFRKTKPLLPPTCAGCKRTFNGGDLVDLCHSPYLAFCHNRGLCSTKYMFAENVKDMMVMNTRTYPR
jgi:hypothetical protein